MNAGRLLGVAIVSLGLSGGALAANGPPGAESEPVEDRSGVSPGLGGSGFEDRAGSAGSVADDPTSGAIRQSNFRAVDENRDGYISREEAAIYPGLDEAFSDLDADGDDQLSAEEFSTWSGTDEQ